jgi:hypothetical protein
MKRAAICTMSVVVVIALCILPTTAAGQSVTRVTGAGSAALPSGTSFNGVPLSGLNFGIGIRIAPDNTARGVLSVTLAGASAGQTVQIVVDGDATSGSVPSAGSAQVSGTCNVDMGNGTPPLTAVPFTLTVAPGANNASTLALLLGTTQLPVTTPATGSVAVE